MNTKLAHNNNNTYKKETKIIENPQNIKILKYRANSYINWWDIRR